MASIKLKKGNAIVFQLLRSNLAGTDQSARDWSEVKVVTLAVNPAQISYTHGNRSQINQTHERNIFVDKFGNAPVRVQMSGTFGLKPRRVGLSMKDGYTRLIEFRDEIVRKANRVNDAEDARDLTDQIDSNAKYVYALNYYDFINDEMFSIDIQQFSISLDSRNNTFVPNYTLAFQEIGDIITATTKDPVLRALLLVSDGVAIAEGLINDSFSYLTDNSIFDTAEFIVGGVDALGGQLENLALLTSLYVSAMQGLTTQAQQIKPTASNAISFTGIKG